MSVLFLALGFGLGCVTVLANTMLADTMHGCLFVLLSSTSWPPPLLHRPQNESGGTDQP